METKEPTMEEEAARGLASLIEDLTELDAESADPDEVQEQVWDWPLCVEALTTIRVTLGTGGPARGIDFTVERDNWGGYEYQSATFWHQDWFQPKGHVQMDDDTGSRLFYMWGLETYQA